MLDRARRCAHRSTTGQRSLGTHIVFLKARIRVALGDIQIFDMIRYKLSRYDLMQLQGQIRQYVGEDAQLLLNSTNKQLQMASLCGKNDPLFIRASISAYPVEKGKPSL